MLPAAMEHRFWLSKFELPMTENKLGAAFYGSSILCACIHDRLLERYGDGLCLLTW
jgi:hypothetical protein